MKPKIKDSQGSTDYGKNRGKGVQDKIICEHGEITFLFWGLQTLHGSRPCGPCHLPENDIIRGFGT